MAKLKNIHPGEILLDKRGITADTALRLSRAFGTSEGFWMGLQADYDLEKTRKRIDGELKKFGEIGRVA